MGCIRPYIYRDQLASRQGHATYQSPRQDARRCWAAAMNPQAAKVRPENAQSRARNCMHGQEDF
jgi:hypothetical protein